MIGFTHDYPATLAGEIVTGIYYYRVGLESDWLAVRLQH